MVDIEELPSAEREDHALVVLLQLIIHLRSHEGGQLALGKRLVLIEGLAVPGLAVRQAIYSVSIHLADGAGDFRPQQIDLLVQAVQGEGLQRRIRLGEEADHAGGGREANHRLRSVLGASAKLTERKCALQLCVGPGEVGGVRVAEEGDRRGRSCGGGARGRAIAGSGRQGVGELDVDASCAGNGEGGTGV